MKKYLSEIYKQTILAIDFDGTIVNNKFPQIGDLLPDAKEVINKLFDEGYYIIIWTCRNGEGLKEAEGFLKDNGIRYSTVNKNAPFVDFNPYPKVYADYYIDDKMLGENINWNNIYNKLKKK